MTKYNLGFSNIASSSSQDNTNMDFFQFLLSIICVRPYLKVPFVQAKVSLSEFLTLF